MIFLFLATSNGPLEAKISSDHEDNFVPQKLVGGGGTFDFVHLDHHHNIIIIKILSSS